MKISKKDFDSMKAKYDKEVKKGKPGKGKKGKDKDDQTNWVILGRAEIEEVLSQTDPKTGAIKFHITEYTEETAAKYQPGPSFDYVGQIALVMEPVNSEDSSSVKSAEDGGGSYYNGGRFCPPKCNQ